MGVYILYCLILIYICKFWYTKKATPVRRIRKVHQEPVGGKRSSQRLRLQKHELVFVDRVSVEEFENQKGAFTKE